MNNLLKLVLILIFSSVLTGCISASIQNNTPVNNPSPNMVNGPVNMPSIHQKEPEKKQDDSDLVTISINNFGRSNPFKPFQRKSITVADNYDMPKLDIPQPPSYAPDESITALLNIKVNGILYDKTKSSAIININGSDYLVHKGDFLFDFHVKDITQDKVAVKYKGNVYLAGIGEIIEGIVNPNPVNKRGMTLPGGNNSAENNGNNSGSRRNGLNGVDAGPLPSVKPGSMTLPPAPAG